MPSLRRAKPLPIPGAELTRLKETLHPEYGSTLHVPEDAEGERILVVRVPRDEPDMVNDVERSVEYLHPGELHDATACLLVGESKTLLVPAQPMRDLMAARVQFDRRQCHLLRGQVKPGEHRLFKAPEDPRRLVRLAIRFGRARVADVDELDLAAAARELGPRLASPALREVRSVYLIADKDDVRMDADQFFQDLGARWGEESERRRLAEEIVQKEAAKRIQQEAERQALLSPLRDLPRQRVAVAPLRQAAPSGAWDADDPSPERRAMYARLDAMLGIRGDPPADARHPDARYPDGRHPDGRRDLPASFTQPRPDAASDEIPVAESVTLLESPADLAPALDPGARRPPPSPASAAVQAALGKAPLGASGAPPAPEPPQLAPLKAALEASGYDVLARPGAHGIDLAAERPSQFPHRLIAYCPARLDIPLADQVLAAARQLQVDLALVVCADAEVEARKRFIATRARWIAPSELETLGL